MKHDQNEALREHVLFLLGGGGAHLNLEDAVASVPPAKRGAKPKDIPHTPWRLLEHIRIAQWDIVDFCTNPDYSELKFPDDYWPESDGPENAADWDRSIKQIRDDLRRMQDLVANPTIDLFARIPWGTGQTILREALLVADHNAYHLGELVTVRRALGIWK